MIVRILPNNKVSVIDIPPDEEDRFIELNPNQGYMKVESLPPSQFECYKWDDTNKQIVLDEECEVQHLKEYLLQQLHEYVTDYIYSYYPIEKQSADNQQKDYYGTALLLIKKNKGQTLTLDQLYVEVADNVNKLRSGQSTLQDLLASYPEDERYYWEQLVKAGLRKAWVVSCTYVFNSFKQKIESATTLDELRKLQANFPQLPEFPL